MAARLVRVDCSRGSSLVICVCGFREIAAGPLSARRLADEHRRTQHPVQARRAAAKRRQRAALIGPAR